MINKIIYLFVKQLFNSNLSKILLHHYVFNNGEKYLMNEYEMIECNVEHVGIKGISILDNEKFNLMLFDKKNVIQLKDYKITGKANTPGTIGRFTINIDGYIYKDIDYEKNNEWKFYGTMYYTDFYNFNPSKNILNEIERTQFGKIMCYLANMFLNGENFEIKSKTVQIFQTNKNEYFDYFEGKSSKQRWETLSRIVNTILTSTVNVKYHKKDIE